MSAAKATTVIDDQQIRVTTWTFGGGDATGPHVHEYDYVVVPVTGGRFTVINSEGATREMTQHAGSPYRGNAGTARTTSPTPATPAQYSWKLNSSNSLAATAACGPVPDVEPQHGDLVDDVAFERVDDLRRRA